MNEPRLEDFVTARTLAEYLGVTERSLSQFRGVPSIELNEGTRIYHRGEVATWLLERGQRQRQNRRER